MRAVHRRDVVERKCRRNMQSVWCWYVQQRRFHCVSKVLCRHICYWPRHADLRKLPGRHVLAHDICHVVACVQQLRHRCLFQRWRFDMFELSDWHVV